MNRKEIALMALEYIATSTTDTFNSNQYHADIGKDLGRSQKKFLSFIMNDGLVKLGYIEKSRGRRNVSFKILKPITDIPEVVSELKSMMMKKKSQKKEMSTSMNAAQLGSQIIDYIIELRSKVQDNGEAKLLKKRILELEGRINVLERNLADRNLRIRELETVNMKSIDFEVLK